MIFWKILKKPSQFWRNLLKSLEEILSCEDFLQYCYNISISMFHWTSKHLLPLVSDKNMKNWKMSDITKHNSLVTVKLHCAAV